MYIDENQKTFFENCIRKAIGDDIIPFPDKLEVNKVYRSVYYTSGNRGCRDLRFVVLSENNGFFLDYFFITDDYSSHQRIGTNGEQIRLENYEGQFGWPILVSEEETKREHERIRIHNENVQSILIAKGLDGKNVTIR